MKWHSLKPKMTAMPGWEASPSSMGLLIGFGMVSKKKGPVLAQATGPFSAPRVRSQTGSVVLPADPLSSNRKRFASPI